MPDWWTNMNVFCSEADDAVCFGKESEKLEGKALNLRVHLWLQAVKVIPENDYVTNESS